MTIDIKMLDKAEVLMVLYNNARILGINNMTIDEARGQLNYFTHFGILNGRAMHIDLGGDSLDTTAYVCANGFNAAFKALQPLLERIE